MYHDNNNEQHRRISQGKRNGIIEMTGARTSCRHKAKHTMFGLYGGVYDLCDKCRLDLPNHIEEHKRDEDGVWRKKIWFECYEKLTPEQRESYRKRELLEEWLKQSHSTW